MSRLYVLFDSSTAGDSPVKCLLDQVLGSCMLQRAFLRLTEGLEETRALMQEFGKIRNVWILLGDEGFVQKIGFDALHVFEPV